MTLRPGEFWVARIVFTDGSGSKVRPVLILWIDGQDVVVAAVTTATPRSKTDVPLADWQLAGLRAPSTVRLSRLDCFDQSLVIGRVGNISDHDAQVVKQVWSSEIRLQF